MEITINLNEWSRQTEVLNYAKEHGITIEEAIGQLVNSGLSHEPRTYL